MQLATQVFDMAVDYPVADVARVCMSRIEQLLAREHPAGLFDQLMLIMMAILICLLVEDLFQKIIVRPQLLIYY